MEYFESMLDYRILTIFVMLIFYGAYFAKMIMQKKRGIKTHQIGGSKDKNRKKVEMIMSFSTVGVVVAQLVSVILDWNLFMTASARLTGFIVAMLGNTLFVMAISSIGDSWRAGIPAKDETQLVTEGMYAVSRNPAFLGFDLMYIGILIMFVNPLMVCFTVLTILSLHLQILQEEKFMEERFGQEYTEYKSKVFRYLGRRK